MVIVSPLKYVPLPNGKWPSWVKKWDDPPSRLSEVTNSMAFFFAFSFSASWETRSIVVSVSVSLVGRCHFGKGEIFPIKNCYTKRESIEREDWIEKLHILIHATLNAKKKTQDNWLLSLVKSASSPIYPNTQQEKNGRSYYINPLETCWFSPILRLLFPTHFFGHDIRLLHSPPLAQQWGVRALRLHWQNSSLRTTLIISPVRDMKHEIIVGIHGGSLFHGPIIISITGCFDNGKFQLTSWRCKVFEPKKKMRCLFEPHLWQALILGPKRLWCCVVLVVFSERTRVEQEKSDRVSQATFVGVLRSKCQVKSCRSIVILWVFI